MSLTTDLGEVTAYAEAVKAGYTGTKEEFEQNMAHFAESAAQVAKDKEDVTLMQQNVSEMQEDVTAKKDAAAQSAEEAAGSASAADTSATAAAGSATAADTSAKNAAVSEKNVNDTKLAFDTHVQEKVSESDTAINDTKQAAIKVVADRQADAVQKVAEQQGISIQKVVDQQNDSTGTMKQQIETYTAEKEKEAEQKISAYTNGEITRANDSMSASKQELSQTISSAEEKKNVLDGRILDAEEADACLNETIGDAEAAKIALDASNAEANQTKIALDASNTSASQTKTDLDSINTIGETLSETLSGKITEGTELKEAIITEGNDQVTRVAAEAATQMSALRGAGGTLEAAVERYYAMRRGKDIYTAEVLDADVTQACTVNRLDGLAGLTCEPSTNSYKGVDEIGALDAFRPTLCNWTLDDEGFQHITAIQGMDNYTEEGPVNVGVLGMGLFYKKERNAEDNGTLHHWSMLPRKDEGYKPMKECIQPDGNIQGWMIHPRGVAVDINGVPYGCNGNPKRNGPSYSDYGYPRKQGPAYCSETDMDAAWILALTLIKYGTRDLQAYMRGCTAYAYQYKVAQAEESTNRVILTTAQANGFVIGSCVSVGEPGANTNLDRYYAYMHNIADSAMITAIEVVDDTHSALVLDVDAPMNVTTNTYVSTMHWRSGSTSKVLGYDGSPVSNTDGKNICKINEIEVLPGGYSVCGNSVNIMEADASGATTCKMYRTTDARTLSTNLDTIMFTYEEVGTMPVTDNTWKYVMSQECDFGEGYFYPTAYGGGDKTYWADAWHTGPNPGAGTKTGRELLRRGGLGSGGLRGPSCVIGGNALSSAHWGVLATLSPNAVRGEWTA